MDVYVWETPDLALASFLAFETNEMPDIEWTPQGTARFCFDETPTLLSLVTKFVSGDAMVEPREFFFKCSDMRKKMNETRPRRR